ncbi:rod shape-determining protein MreC [Candidatus Manganitrophus noduliformans]|uniref:Cell shape-determining protein MreC n=1 Tax=Candidatus Manganitrophus noduliformans TaxID=2606439 RepID=A0A7X6DNN2_9BACT|nr:rod shape-determining protein MreC [Candidatus Manganitrophus noduliformans]NKE70442.1 rod shape-determining protein MreC [Candidatus Manganitrophus noduliformans]
MLRRRNIYKRFLILSFILGLTIVFISPELQKRPLRWVEVPIGGAVYYVQQGTHAVLEGISGVWYGYINLIHVQRENQQLREEIGRLRGENNLLEEEGALAERLQAILDYKQSAPFNLIVASVIGREPSHWYQTVIVNKGEAEGVKVDMGVITPEGVVGKVIKTGPRHAQVLLMTDRNSAVAAIVQRTRDEGIVQGIEEGAVRLKYLPHFSEVVVGDVLVTSGLEGSFAKGLKIGEIEKVEKREHELFLQVKVTPQINFSNLEEVLIITSTDERDG